MNPVKHETPEECLKREINEELGINTEVNDFFGESLLDIFKCGNMGGMRRSQKTNTLVIISDHTKGLYEDKWVGDEELETELEAKISQYLRDNITFVCFPVDEEAERLRLEEGIITTLNRHPLFGPSNNWLGLNSPVPEIASSGLWNRQGLEGQPLSDEELERVKWLARFGNDSYRNNA